MIVNRATESDSYQELKDDITQVSTNIQKNVGEKAVGTIFFV